MKKLIAVLAVAIMAMSLVACSGPKGEFTFDVPEGLTLDENYSKEGVAEAYRLTGKATKTEVLIVHTNGYSDGSFETLTPKKVQDEMIKQVTGNGVTPVLIDSREYDVDGAPAIRYEFQYLSNHKYYNVIFIVVDAGLKYHSLIYYTGSDNEYYDKFVESADNIRFE